MVVYRNANSNFPVKESEILSNKDFLKLCFDLGIKMLDSRENLLQILTHRVYKAPELESINSFIKEKSVLSKIKIDKFHLNLNQNNFNKNPHIYMIPFGVDVTGVILFKLTLKNTNEVFYNVKITGVNGNYRGVKIGERIIVRPSFFTKL